MRRFLFSITLLIAIPTLVCAIDFSPTVLSLSAPSSIQYDFDGTDLEIPVIVSGTPARTLFLVYTKDQKDNINEVRNGYLGWHYVHKIDTSVYVSDINDFNTGDNTIFWDGNDDDGALVPSGEYTYYLWAYDFESMKERAIPNIENIGTWLLRNFTSVFEYDEEGNALERPVFYHSEHGDPIINKWVIGNDPEDASLVETTDIDEPEEWLYRQPGQTALHPEDHSIIFLTLCNAVSTVSKAAKYSWTPNGVALKDDSWGEDLSWNHNTKFTTGFKTDGNYLYFGSHNNSDSEPNAYFHIIDFEGSEVENFMLEWYIKPDELAAGSPMLNGGPSYFDMRDGKGFLGNWFCMFQMIDPMAYLESGDMEDFTLWCNMNGDYINDRQWQEDAETPWMCFGEGAPHASSLYADANLFSVTPQYDMGAVSFALTGPDGDGIDHFSFAGETAGYKKGQIFIQNGSAYDGMYSDNVASVSEDASELGRLMYTGHDSIKGTITSSPIAVEEDVSAAFSVAQNSPNPFNPTTTINFTIAEVGNGSVDVFNVAGQKVDTLVSGFMDAGSHSVVWDASEFSAGVYFCTVRAGSFSKTMKMTLLK